MPKAISSAPFHALASDLKKTGHTVHGARLESTLNGVWTTSTELTGELGQVVIAIRRECHPLTGNQKALIKECLKQVRKAWPGFGIFSFFRLW